MLFSSPHFPTTMQRIKRWRRRKIYQKYFTLGFFLEVVWISLFLFSFSLLILFRFLVAGIVVAIVLLALRTELFDLFNQKQYADGAAEYFYFTAPLSPFTYLKERKEMKKKKKEKRNSQSNLIFYQIFGFGISSDTTGSLVFETIDYYCPRDQRGLHNTGTKKKKKTKTLFSFYLF